MRHQLRYNTSEPFADLRAALRHAAETYPARPALMQRQGRYYEAVNYADLIAVTDGLGTSLCDLGLKGRHVIILGSNSITWSMAFLAVVNGLGVAVPADGSRTAGELAELAERCDAGAVIYSADCSAAAENLPEGIIKICFSSFPELIRKGRQAIGRGDHRYSSLVIDPDATACIVYTGSGDGAGGAMLSHSALCFDLWELGRAMKYTPSDLFMALAPFSHTYGLSGGLLFPLSAGACVAFNDGLRFLTRDIRDIRPTVICCTPALLKAVYANIRASIASRGPVAERLSRNLVRATYGDMRLKRHAFRQIHDALGGRIRLFMCGGAKADPASVTGMRDMGFRVISAYGLAECAPFAALNGPGRYRKGAVGRPAPGGIMDIYDIRKDGTGEIRYKGRNVMSGYYGDPEATAGVIRGGWFYTGDFGYKDKNGYLHITGSRKNLIVTASGRNIYPEELEEQLCRSGFVSEAVVVAYPNEALGEYDILAVLVPDSEALASKYGRRYVPGQTEAELKRAVDDVNGLNAAYKHIGYFVERDRPFLHNAAGKIIRDGVAEESFGEYRKKLTRSN